ncbi:transcriptional repressor [Sphaerothrix gracilis]|uniref:Fur family transcriptional regulator n=1 Tax=Sphaerothrix gracilis TaxID=3151835 RepID=UPI0031FD0811
MATSEPESHIAQHSETLRSLLNQEGFRFTDQRKKILEVFKNAPVGHHLSAEEIYQRLSDQGKNISISTVYRAVHLMVNLNLLRELGLAEDKKYYELSAPFMHQHHHLVCVQCGTVQEFEEDLITTVSINEAEERGFAISNCQFTVFALCPTCQRLHYEDN